MPFQELKYKRLIRVKNPKKAIFIETNYWFIWVQTAKSSSLSVSWKLNASLTQKDTMDRGAWIKIQKERHEEDSRGQKVHKHKRCKMALEWGTNEYFCLPCVPILWCLSWKVLKDRGKMKLIYLALKESSLLWDFGFPFFLKLDCH